MIRTMLAIAAGYFSITAINSFVHLIVSIYFKTDVTLTGVSNLPSTTWLVGFTILQFGVGLFGGLLASTIAKNPHRVVLGFILLMVAISLVDYSVLSDREPLWYLIISPALKISGIFMGFKLIQVQNKSTTADQKS